MAGSPVVLLHDPSLLGHVTPVLWLVTNGLPASSSLRNVAGFALTALTCGMVLAARYKPLVRVSRRTSIVTVWVSNFLLISMKSGEKRRPAYNGCSARQ